MQINRWSHIRWGLWGASITSLQKISNLDIEDSDGARHLPTLIHNWGASIQIMAEHVHMYRHVHTQSTSKCVLNKGYHMPECLSHQDVQLWWRAAASVWCLCVARDCDAYPHCCVYSAPSILAASVWPVREQSALTLNKDHRWEIRHVL